MFKPEILAPAGSLEILKAAILAGADAVYCSGKNFGARSFAPNFTDEELKEACEYTHLRKKKIYVTVNTLIFEEELSLLKEYLAYLYCLVDGIIVQDLGVFHYVRKTFPDFPVHMSTQCNIHNLEMAKFYQQLGATRIVLARETPLDVIKEIMTLGIEVEVFVHGALCFSYSGNCYMSKMIGERSGNRGSCAQPCRKQYTLYEDNKAITNSCSLLSMKDLMTIEYLDKLCELGVHSFKIEGRMKQKEYVVTAVKAYRKALDKWLQGKEYSLEEKTNQDLHVTFNREFTKGYGFSASNSSVTNIQKVNHQGINIGKVLSSNYKTVIIQLSNVLRLHDAIRIIDNITKKEAGMIVTRIEVNHQNVKEATTNQIVTIDFLGKITKGSKVIKTQDANLMEMTDNLLKKVEIHSPISGKLVVSKQEMIFEIQDDCFTVNVKKVVNLEKAKKDVDILRIKKQLSKVDKLPFIFKEIIIEMKDSYFIPISLINQIRNEALGKWQLLYENCKDRQIIPYINKETKKLNSTSNSWSVLFRKDQLNDFNRSNLEIYSPKESSSRIDFHHQLTKKVKLAELVCDLQQGVDVSPYLNITNSEAIEFTRMFTNGTIFLSLELSLSHISSLAKFDSNLGVLLYSKIPLMISNHCVIAKVKKFEDKKCGLCNRHQYQIKDGYDNLFDLFLQPCQMIILNNKPRNWFNNKRELALMGINHYLIEFYNENQDDIINILEKCK